MRITLILGLLILVNTSCKKTKSINGCTDTKAINYNFFAKVEDCSFKYHYYESENFPT
jgi:hypothetical protein